jgi:lysophospholipase L1-like esterase
LASIRASQALRRANRHRIGIIEAVAMFSRYVALGDSFTEGVGDPHPASPNGLRGWADHVAMALAQNNPELRYANLAVRGRRMDEILTEQVQTAVMLEPDLVTVYAGMNDLLLVRNDIDGKMARYADGLKTLQQTGARVLVFTAGDLGTVPLFRRLRGRAAVYNELLRSIAEDLGLQLIDFWRFSEFRDPRLWDGDRIHLSPLGHERMAAKVLDSLTVPHELATRSVALLRSTPPVRDFRANLRWTTAFAAPWVAKRVRRATPGAGIEPKSTALVKVL